MDESRQLLCIGHRGAMGHAPENTLLSIEKALALGVRFIEVDVHSVDGHLVVFHDDRLERTTNGEGYLAEQSFDHLRSLDAGEGQQIPTLDEVCNLVSGRACINIELKGPGTAAPVAALASRLIQGGWDKRAILVSSFDHRQLEELQHLDGDIQLAALLGGLPIDDARIAEKLGCFSVHPSIEFLDRRFVDDAHSRGLRVFTYTVSHPEDLHRCAALGVDGVFTDYPERVLKRFSQGMVRDRWEGFDAKS